ncbi:carbon-nitrogen hydrolase family protein [Rhodococcoides yunnanense]|uniref:carbon-nitrogen hydrolase family protein n=1 Tax=Rhodococcoides yunnanense TaxID=278209 RepID=UPI0009346E8F|nr:carbon-nitrogen hydrolase family protein [Rhodococcus yunnanensis]
MSTRVRASLFQGPEMSGDVACNLDAIEHAATRSAEAGSAVLVTPEMSATGYDIGDLVHERAESSDGPIFLAVSEIARRVGVAVVYGYPERAGGRVYNSVQVVDASGTSIARYRKTHLFGDLDRGRFLPGEELVVQFELGGIVCGLLTCYDVEFPETVRAHADAGTQWLVVPTGLMVPFDIVATHIVPARAYESQVFVTYVNRCGRERDLQYCGSTCAIAPDGTELGRAGRGEATLTVDIDPAALDSSRAINTHLDDRRRDLYTPRTG